MFVFLLLTVLVAILVERKVLGRMQMRFGPNRVGPFGLLQSLADGVKLALKEGLTPAGVDKPIYLMAPVIAVIPAFMAFAVIPMGPVVSVFGHRTPLQLTDLPVAVLYVLAVTSIGVYGIVLAGWASGSTYPLLGGLRSSAQVVSYEIAMALSFAAVFLYAGTMSTSGIVAVADPHLVRLPAAAVVRGVPDGDGGRDQPGPVRPARSRGRTGRRLPHRVLQPEVRDVHARRIRQHDHGFGVGHHDVPRRLARPVADQHVGRREHRVVAADLVRRQGVGLPVLLHLAARHPAATALRPVHGAGLEGPDPASRWPGS